MEPVSRSAIVDDAASVFAGAGAITSCGIGGGVIVGRRRMGGGSAIERERSYRVFQNLASTPNSFIDPAGKRSIT
jgi:hypothetical protein